MKRAVIVLLAAVLPGAAGAGEDKPSKAIDELRQCVDPQRLPEERVEHCTGALRAGTLDAGQTANAHYHSGLASLAMGNQEKAIEEFDQVLRIEPEMAKAYNGRGIARTQHGDLDRAIADYDQALRIEPKLAYVYANRGSAWLSKGDPDRAIADFDAALELRPSHPESMLKGRGMAWQAKGDLTRAMADYDEALKLAPAYGKAIVSRGYGYLARGDYAAAAADLGRAQQLAADPYAALALSLAHLRAGRLDKAELEEYAKRFGTDAWPGPVMAMLHGVLSPAEALDKARDEKGENNREHACTVHFYAGEWYLQQKLVDQARAQLTRARDRCARSTPEFSLASVELSHLH